MYHRVCPQDDGWSLKAMVVSPDAFQRQMRYISTNYQVWPLQKLVECLRTGNPLSGKTAIVTFDDGYKDVYTHAYPILKKYNIPATVFLATGPITNRKLFWWDEIIHAIHNTTVKRLSLEFGSYSLESRFDRFSAKRGIISALKEFPNAQRRFWVRKLVETCQVNTHNSDKDLLLSWEDVEEMHYRNISFQAHSVNHPILTKIPLEEAEAEIVQSKKDIEERLGVEVTAFSYPSGDFNADIIKLVRRNGFSCAVSSVQRQRLINPKDAVYSLNRIGASEYFGIFKVKMCGLWGDMRVRATP